MPEVLGEIVIGRDERPDQSKGEEDARDDETDDREALAQEATPRIGPERAHPPVRPESDRRDLSGDRVGADRHQRSLSYRIRGSRNWYPTSTRRLLSRTVIVTNAVVPRRTG